MGFLQLCNMASVFALPDEEFQQRPFRDRSHEALGIGNQKAVPLSERHRRQTLEGKDNGNPDPRQDLLLVSFHDILGGCCWQPCANV